MEDEGKEGHVGGVILSSMKTIRLPERLKKVKKKKNKKPCNPKHWGLVKKRNNVLISNQSDDSLHWIIPGKPPTKQN